MTTIGQVEINEGLRRILSRHWPDVPRHDDVRTAGEWWASRSRPVVDVVSGGFPCQPFSLAGRLSGVADERWGWPWFFDAVRAVEPRYVIIENVSALLGNGEAFSTILSDLASVGFDAEWNVFSAGDVGAPQAARERVFCVAYRPCINRNQRGCVGEGEQGGASIAAGGLPRLSVAERRRRADSWIESEPNVDRMVNGVPDRLALLGYGNAVIPALAKHIGDIVMQHELHCSV